MQTVNNGQKMISVIIPVYNVKLYVEEAINSVIDQTYSLLEIIIIDDGSTDGSGKICDQFAEIDQRIKVVHQKNRGLSAARNVGLNICKGDYIAFLDPDDAFCKNALSKMQKEMEESGADIVECNYAIYSGSGKMNPSMIHKKPLGDVNEYRKSGLYDYRYAIRMQPYGLIISTAWNKLYKRKVWEQLRFREGQNYEDIDIILPLIEESEKICVLNDVLIMHRKRKDSITATLSRKNLRDRYFAYYHYTGFIRAHIPKYFKVCHLNLVNEQYFASLLRDYYKYMVYRIPDRIGYFSLLEKEIIHIQKKICLKECGRKLRIKAWLFSHTPHAVSGIVYWLYRPFLFFVKRVSAR